MAVVHVGVCIAWKGADIHDITDHNKNGSCTMQCSTHKRIMAVASCSKHELLRTATYLANLKNKKVHVEDYYPELTMQCLVMRQVAKRGVMLLFTHCNFTRNGNAMASSGVACIPSSDSTFKLTFTYTVFNKSWRRKL